jgi:drug/metabolite transporter (DMT)-like permease
MNAAAEHRASAWLVYTACAWGANVVALKVMTNAFAIVHLTAIRMAVAFVCIAAICRFTRHRIVRLDPAQFGWLSAAAALMIYAHQLLLSQGLAWSTATNGSLALSLNPVLSVLLGAALFGERLSLARVAGVTLGLLGVGVVVLNRSGAELHLSGGGDALLIASMVVYVAAGACIRHVAGRIHPLVIGFYMHLFGTLMLTVHAAFTPSFWQADAWFPSTGVWLLVLLSALFSTAIGNLAWNNGISRLGLARTSMFINLLPLSGLLAAVGFLHETLRPAHAVGFACVLAGTWLALRDGPAAQRVAAAS